MERLEAAGLLRTRMCQRHNQLQFIWCEDDALSGRAAASFQTWLTYTNVKYGGQSMLSDSHVIKPRITLVEQPPSFLLFTLLLCVHRHASSTDAKVATNWCLMSCSRPGRDASYTHAPWSRVVQRLNGSRDFSNANWNRKQAIIFDVWRRLWTQDTDLHTCHILADLRRYHQFTGRATMCDEETQSFDTYLSFDDGCDTRTVPLHCYNGCSQPNVLETLFRTRKDELDALTHRTSFY